MKKNSRPDSRQENPRTAAPRRRSTEAKDQFRTELVHIARRLFEQEGSSAVSMRAIASAAGVSPMAVYRYFPNKMTLLSQLWDSVFEDLAQAVEDTIDADLPLREQVARVIDAYIDFWLARPDHFRMIYVEPALNPQAQAELTFWTESPALARLRVLVVRALTFAGGPTALDDPRWNPTVEQISIYMSGLLHTLIGRPEGPWLNHTRAREGAHRVTLKLLDLLPPPATECVPTNTSGQ